MWRGVAVPKGTIDVLMNLMVRLRDVAVPRGVCGLMAQPTGFSPISTGANTDLPVAMTLKPLGCSIRVCKDFEMPETILCLMILFRMRIRSIWNPKTQISCEDFLAEMRLISIMILRGQSLTMDRWPERPTSVPLMLTAHPIGHHRILVIAVLVFRVAAKISAIMGDLRQRINSFKKGLKD